MADGHDEHDGPIHQAPWVVPMTVGICLGVVALFMAVRFFFGADFGSPM